jgi:hypothetical protein
MEPQPLGAFYGRSCHNLQVFSGSFAGSHRSRGHIIRIGDFLRGGVWGIYRIARGWLVLRDQKSIYANN